MQSARVDIFLSCSFKDEDKEVNDLFESICTALDIKAVNVETAYTQVPPDKARDLIENSQALIAIAVKRESLSDDKYAMPPSVHDEISMAYGMKTPVLLFLEENVSFEGMAPNYGTYLRFSRDNIKTPETLKKIIKAIHNLKMDIVAPHELIYDHESTEFIADYHKHLIELKEDGDDYYWSYSITKKLTFLKTFKKFIPAAFWASVPSSLPESPPKIEWECIVENHTRNLDLKIDVEEHTPDCLRALCKVEPHPEKGDFIEFSTFAKSRYFNPIYDDEISVTSFLRTDEGHYKAFDGLIPIQRIKKLLLEIRIPRGYPLEKKDIIFFVGSYTDGIDYIVESEIKRANVTKESIGGNLSLRVEVESPLLRHLYGFAWNPIKRLDA